MSQVNFNPGQARINPDDTAVSGPGGPAPAGPGAAALGPALGPPPASGPSGGVDLAALGLPTLSAPHPGPLSLEQLVRALSNEARQLGVQQGVENIKETHQARMEEARALSAARCEELFKNLGILGKLGKLRPFVEALTSAGTLIFMGLMTGNPLMIAGGAISVALKLNNVITTVTGGKVNLIASAITALAKKLGYDDEVAKWLTPILEKALPTIGFILSIGGAAQETIRHAIETGFSEWTIKHAMDIIELVNFAYAGEKSFDGRTDVTEWGDALTRILEQLKQKLQTDKDLQEALRLQTEGLRGQAENIIGRARNIARDTISAQAAIQTGGGGAHSLA